jgi:hypothetical protein
MKNGFDLILEERQRQINSEKYSIQDDARYVNQELYWAALAYHLNDVSFWPWDKEYFKPTGDKVKDFIKAGALYHAELDRINFTTDQEDGITRHKEIVAWSMAVISRKITYLNHAKDFNGQTMKELLPDSEYYVEPEKGVIPKYIPQPSVNQQMLEALKKIAAMKLNPDETDYKYAFNRCWHIAVEAITNFEHEINES